jgi:hypothetical protein
VDKVNQSTAPPAQTQRKARDDVEPRCMVALLLALALVALTLIVLAMAGVVAAAVTGLAALNVLTVVLGVVVQRRRSRGADTWPETPPPSTPTHRITGGPTKALPASSEASYPRPHAATSSRRNR